MEQRYEANRQTGLWLERLVWNVAAGAVLAVMILLLLGSIRLLDRVESVGIGAERETPTVGTAAAEPPRPEIVVGSPLRPTEVAEFNRPSP